MPNGRLRCVQALFAVSATLLACAASGCGSLQSRILVNIGEVPEGIALPGAEGTVAAFAPAELRVHPLSRLDGTGTARRAILHLELVDAFGHDVKWPGVTRVEFTGSRGAGSLFPPAWVDLTSGEMNAASFDSISRCYVLKLPAPDGSEVPVNARWLLGLAEGRRVWLEARGVLTESR